MAKLMDDTMEDGIQISGAAGSSFKFSAVKIDDLANLANDFTLVTICRDRSGSVSGFSAGIDKATEEIIEACKKSPRAENLLIRIIDFDNQLEEVHGFKILNKIDPKAYKLSPRGMTALFDATYSGVGATLTYAETLTNQDFNVNGIVFVITDGGDNASKATPKMIADMKKQAIMDEKIESLLTILIGVNVTDPYLTKALNDFKVDAAFDQYEEVSNASASTLAKIAQFVSKSISAQSQSLGTGGPSQTLTF